MRFDLEEEMLQFIACAMLALLLGSVGVAGAQDLDAARKGAPAYRLCGACHSLKSGVHLSGPSLADVWGKPAGTNPSYRRYTAALEKAGADIVWDENTLNAWIADPQAMVPGTAMTFRGIPQNDVRANLIEFLRLALAQGGTAKTVTNGLISQSAADGQIPPDLSSVPDRQRIKDIRHCGDAYYITTADGTHGPFWESNVRLKTDTSARGPKPGHPVLLRSGMVGDRVTAVFSGLADLNRTISEQCSTR